VSGGIGKHSGGKGRIETMERGKYIEKDVKLECFKVGKCKQANYNDVIHCSQAYEGDVVCCYPLSFHLLCKKEYSNQILRLKFKIGNIIPCVRKAKGENV
jgi:hypothetical protein